MAPNPQPAQPTPPALRSVPSSPQAGAPATAGGPWRRRLIDALLTSDPVQRLRLSQAGLALLLMAVSVAALHYAAMVGGAAPGWVWAWSALSLGGLLAAYALIRSGWSQRLADPSLTVPQMVLAIACAAGAYALAGPLRGGVFPVLMVILMFGMFQLRPGRIAAVSLYAVLLFGAVMALLAWQRPAVYRPEVEFGHFLMVATMLPAVSLLSERLWRLRERGRRQREELAAALARIQQLATRDELTGLINRRHMVELLEQERQRCVRSGHTFCIALIDLDRFKDVNDRLGHAAGDAVLRRFAQEACAAIRAADVLARWGGDEFVLLLTGTTAGLGRSGVERLLARLAQHHGPDGGGGPGIGFSCGLTEHIAGEPVSQALERADRALYDAKAAGRGRVVVA
jgi:diguanylate cyclase (GGDEF)-like protein